jgi:hypothetical protein
MAGPSRQALRVPSQRLLTIALGALSIPALSFVAYVAAHSVSDNPDPQVILPVNTRAPAPHPGTDRLAGRTDHPATSGSAPSDRQIQGGATLVTPPDDADNRPLTGPTTTVRSSGRDGPGSPIGTQVTSPTTATTTPGVDANVGTGHDGTTPGNPTTVPATLPSTSTTDDRHPGPDDGSRSSGRDQGGGPDASMDGAPH